MGTFGLNNIRPSKLYDEDIIRLDGESMEQWVSRMRKWSGQYRRLYGKLYYRIYIKEIYKQEDLTLYLIMTNKSPNSKVNPNDMSKPKKICRGNQSPGFSIERKYIKLDFT